MRGSPTSPATPPTTTSPSRVDVDGDVVRLVVADRGRPATPPDPDTTQFGLVGMAERARALGGQFEAGPTDDGWRVEVRLLVSP